MPTKGYVSVGIPKGLAELIDAYLEDERYKRRNRNQFVVDAIRHYLPIAREEEDRLTETLRR